MNKRALNMVAVLILVLIVILSSRAQLGADLEIQRVLTIESAGDGRAFTYPIDLAIGKRGDIYVLDSTKAIITRYDKQGKYLSDLGVPAFKSRSLEEINRGILRANKNIREIGESNKLLFPKRIYYHGGKIYVLDIGKIVIFSESGEIETIIPLREIQANWLIINRRNAIIVGGFKKDSDKVFHIVDLRGATTRSFGDYPEIPPRIRAKRLPQVDDRMLSLPINCTYSEQNDEYYILSPFSYKIDIYKDFKRTRSIANTNNYMGLFGGIVHVDESGQFQGYGTSVIDPPIIMSMDNHELVFRPDLQKNDYFSGTEDRSYLVDCYLENELQKTLKPNIKGMPLAMDDEGFIYIIENNGSNPIVSKNVLKINW
jgi:hypothetical protein